MLFSVVLRNDGEINVIDHARVVKTFRDPLSSLSDYLSVIYQNARTDYRLALWLRLASPKALAALLFGGVEPFMQFLKRTSCNIHVKLYHEIWTSGSRDVV